VYAFREEILTRRVHELNDYQCCKYFERDKTSIMIDPTLHRLASILEPNNSRNISLNYVKCEDGIYQKMNGNNGRICANRVSLSCYHVGRA
jgi:hypothetical protein